VQGSNPGHGRNLKQEFWFNVHLKTSPQEPKDGTCAGPKPGEEGRVDGGV